MIGIADFECPHCAKEFDIGDHPDHLSEASSNQGRVDFECSDCGCKFDLHIEWRPSVDVDEDTIKRPVESAST